jgi:hypothetical protein
VAYFCHFSGRFSSLPAPKTGPAEYSVRANICQAFWHKRCLRNTRSATSWYGRRSAARLEGLSLQEIGGSCRYRRGKSNRAASFVRFRLLGRRAHPRAAPEAVNEDCLLPARKNNGEKRSSAMLSNRSAARKFVRHRRQFPLAASGRSPVQPVEHFSLRAAWKYAYLSQAPVRLTRRVE